MIYSVREPHSFEISFKLSEVVCVSVAFVVQIDSFEGFAYKYVPFAELVKCDVSSCECSFSEIVGEGLLLEGEFFEVLKSVSEYSYIGEVFYDILKLIFCHLFVVFIVLFLLLFSLLSF